MAVIVYQNDEGGVSIVYPTPEFADQIEAVAAKDVPEGMPWRVMDAADLPDRSTRNRWRWSASGPLSIAPEE
jgi:hypothetical protein